MQPNHYNTSTTSVQQQQAPWGSPFPSLHMWPLHETFSMKMIYLPDSQRIKIGRQTNAKTVPGERNAFFDSKVLSRLHAEVWEQSGKIYIRDSKSSNGTFINNDRLSPEGVESEPFELKNEDIVEFGIDIVSDDGRTIIHHKVASKIYCVFNADDAALSARELVHYQNHNRRPGPQQPPPNPSAPMAMSAGGKVNGLSFEHVMMKLQTELAKSRETGVELQELTGNMGDIQETLGGGLPPSQNGMAAQFIPPQFRSNSAEAKAALAGPHGQQAAAFIALQNQLSETQSSLNVHIDRIKGLENSLNSSESVRMEVATLRQQMEESKREMDLLVAGNRGRTLSRRIEDEEYDDDDDDDTRSVSTVMDNLERDDSMRREKRQKVNGDHAASGDNASKSLEEMSTRNQELASRVQTLSVELSEASRLSQHLQSQHDEAMAALGTLTQRIGSLESGLAGRIADAVSESDRKWETWRTHVEDGWKSERESWEAERERLRGVVRDWEEASRRAKEEEEDRALNARLSADELSDEEEDEEDDQRQRQRQRQNGGSTIKPEAGRKSNKRRRPSNRTTLALRALRDVSNTEGTSTPTQAPPALLSPERTPGTAHPRKEGDEGSASGGSDKSTESGKESVDTLRDRDAGARTRPKRGSGAQVGDVRAKNQVPFFTVLVVAVFAGALYYRHKD